jgi:hypothetical protein
MGCRSSTCAADGSLLRDASEEDCRRASEEVIPHASAPAKRIANDLPPDAANAVKSEGSETSTDDSNSSSLHWSGTQSGDTADTSADAPDFGEALGSSEKLPETFLPRPSFPNKIDSCDDNGCLDLDRYLERYMDQFVHFGNDAFFEPVIPDDQHCSKELHHSVVSIDASPETMLRRRVSCMLGTTPRDPSRRVSFNEDGPDVVHIETLEMNCGTLRRASPVNVGGFEPLDDPDLEAVLHMRAAHELEALAELAASEAAKQPLPPRTLGSDWALCCVVPGDGDRSPPLSPPSPREDWEKTMMPYASHMVSRNAREEEREDVPLERDEAFRDLNVIHAL